MIDGLKIATIICSNIVDSASPADWQLGYKGPATDLDARVYVAAFLSKFPQVRVIVNKTCVGDFRRGFVRLESVQWESGEQPVLAITSTDGPKKQEQTSQTVRKRDTSRRNAPKSAKQLRKARKKQQTSTAQHKRVMAVSDPGCVRVDYKDSRWARFPMSGGRPESHRRRH